MDNWQISLAAARVNANLTQKQLGDAIGVSEKTINNWESGENLPNVRWINPLETALGMSINHIRFGR